MTTLRARIGLRSSDEVLVHSAGRRLTVAEALAQGISGTFTPRCVALRVSDPLFLIRLLIALDGRTEGLALLSAAHPPATTLELARAAGADLVITDGDDLAADFDGTEIALATPQEVLSDDAPTDAMFQTATQWILTTSGTTGLPKLVRHQLEGLTRTVVTRRAGSAAPVWGLTYEATRFAGLQVVLQALLGGGTLLAEDLSAPLGTRLEAFAKGGVTHLSATPTLWRRILMHPACADLALRQITLGGEIADDHLLGTMTQRFSKARITHIYASTEVGVGFSVKDGRAGFPQDWLTTPPEGIEMKVHDDRLWLKAPGAQSAYLGPATLTRDAQGFVDTQDRVICEDGRVRFLGRDSGVINVGGAKVHPETLEHVLNAHPQVALSRITAKKNPFSGQILVADVQPNTPPEDPGTFKTALLQYCRSELPLEAVPALIRITDEIAVNAAGKVIRG